MIDEVSDVLGWDRKHAIKALNGKVSLGKKARRRGSKATYSEVEKAVVVGIWKHSEQPCGTRLKQTLPLKPCCKRLMRGLWWALTPP